MMSSTRARESALRSSTNEASGFTSASSTPSCSTTIFLRRSYIFWSAKSANLPAALPRPPASPPAPGKCRARHARPSIGAPGPPTDGRREHPVDELRRRLGPEQLGQLDRFVDDHAGRGIAKDTELEQGDAKHVLVDLGHLVDRPLRRQGRDLRVELLAVGKHALDELPGEIRRLLGQAGAERAARPGVPRVTAVEVDLEQGLQGHAARRMAAGAFDPLHATGIRLCSARTAMSPWDTD